MKKLILIFASLVCVMFTAQNRSLRQLLSEADIVVVTEKIPDPFYPREKRITISDHKSFLKVDSVKINSYLRKNGKVSSDRKFVIDYRADDAFFEKINVPEHIQEVLPVSADGHRKIEEKQTVLFAKSGKDFVNVLYFCELTENEIASLKEFITWMDETTKIKRDDERYKTYIKEYISKLGSNSFTLNLQYFDNILLPDSDFMAYYKAKNPAATILSTEQKERFKSYLLDEENYFNDIKNTELLYSFFPSETLDFYREKLGKVRQYDDDFEENPARYNDFIKFVLVKMNLWNKDNELLLEVLEDSYSNNISLKRDVYEQLISKINTKKD